MIGPDDGKDRTVDRQRAAASDLREVLDRRNLVPAARVVRGIAGCNGLSYFSARADEQPTTLTWRLATRMGRNGIQYRLPDKHVASVAGSLQASG